MSEFTGIKKDLCQYWNTQGSIYDFCHESEEECSYWQHELNEVLGNIPKKILDVGTGTGFIAMNLAMIGHDVTGLDFSEGMINQAKEKMQKHSLSWNLVMGDAEHPDFPPESFDTVICRYVLWTLPNPEVAISEWVKLIKPGGRIVVIDGKRQRVDNSTSAKFNRFLWKLSRRICCGYSGIQGHDLTLEKDLPYFEGISKDEIINLFTREDLADFNIRTLDKLPDIIRCNLPWYMRFGYHSSGMLYIVSGKKH